MLTKQDRYIDPMIFLVYWFTCEVLVFYLSRPHSLTDFDYILVLGNKGGVDNPVKRDRAANAAFAKRTFPNAKIILTGNEKKYLEVTNLKKLLIAENIIDFIEEKESLNTWDNMIYSMKLMKAMPRVLVVTSQYHQPRSLAMARSLGMKAESFGKDKHKYKQRYLHILKERLSNMLYAPRILFNFLFN